MDSQWIPVLGDSPMKWHCQACSDWHPIEYYTPTLENGVWQFHAQASQLRVCTRYNIVQRPHTDLQLLEHKWAECLKELSWWHFDPEYLRLCIVTPELRHDTVRGIQYCAYQTKLRLVGEDCATFSGKRALEVFWNNDSFIPKFVELIKHIKLPKSELQRPIVIRRSLSDVPGWRNKEDILVIVSDRYGIPEFGSEAYTPLKSIMEKPRWQKGVVEKLATVFDSAETRLQAATVLKWEDCE